MTTILDGARVAELIRSEVLESVGTMTAGGARPPGLAVILAGEDPASEVYVRSKTRAAEKAGFEEHTIRLAGDVDAASISSEIARLNAADDIDGILVQLPLPDGVSERPILLQIDPDKDVDGLHPVNIGRLWSDEPGFVPCTPAGILELLRRSDVPMTGQRAVVVGRSLLVGKPVAALLLKENSTVTLCHSRTRDLAGVCREADILVAAIGQPAAIGPQHVKEGAVVVDVGINRIRDREVVSQLFRTDPRKLAAFEKRGSVLAGDVDYARVSPLASAITPVPGGVGPLTVAMLLANTLDASRRRQGLA